MSDNNYLPIVETFTLPLGVKVAAHYEDIGPAIYPPSGAEWDRRQDLPRVQVVLALPRECKPLYGPIVFGETVSATWGYDRAGLEHYYPCPMGSVLHARISNLVFVRERVSEAFEAARAAVKEAVEILRTATAARAARIAARETTAALAREGSPFRSEP